jgi:hypothetical protein
MKSHGQTAFPQGVTYLAKAWRLAQGDSCRALMKACILQSNAASHCAITRIFLNQMGADDDVCPWLIRLSNSRKSGRNCQMKGRPAGLSPRPLLCDQSPPLMCYRWNGLYSSLMGCPECLPLEQSSWVRVLRRWTFEFSGEKLSSVAGPSTTRRF